MEKTGTYGQRGAGGETEGEIHTLFLHRLSAQSQENRALVGGGCRVCLLLLAAFIYHLCTACLLGPRKDLSILLCSGKAARKE